MGMFKTAEKFEEVIGGFFQLIADTPLVADKLLKSKMIIRFMYSDPDLTVVVDCSGDKAVVRPHDTETKAIVEMSMSADIAHRFWFGMVNLTKALTRKEMIAKGPIPKVLKLLPAIKPTYAMYPKYLDENGFEEFNITKAYKPPTA
jgi:SCP-2 sterol transfer family protein